MFVKLCLDPGYSSNFKSYIALAPVVFADKMRSTFLRILIDFHIEDIWEIMMDHKFLFLSHDDVSPMYGLVINSISGMTIDII